MSPRTISVQFDVERALAVYAVRDGKLVDTGAHQARRRAGVDPVDATVGAG